jgi:hypothetical protein
LVQAVAQEQIPTEVVQEPTAKTVNLAVLLLSVVAVVVIIMQEWVTMAVQAVAKAALDQITALL